MTERMEIVFEFAQKRGLDRPKYNRIKVCGVSNQLCAESQNTLSIILSTTIKMIKICVWLAKQGEQTKNVK